MSLDDVDAFQMWVARMMPPKREVLEAKSITMESHFQFRDRFVSQ